MHQQQQQSPPQYQRQPQQQQQVFLFPFFLFFLFFFFFLCLSLPHTRTTQNVPLSNDRIRENVQGMKATVELFAETLSYIHPEDEDATKNEFLQELHERCKGWQKHITGHLEVCTDDSLLGEPSPPLRSLSLLHEPQRDRFFFFFWLLLSLLFSAASLLQLNDDYNARFEYYDECVSRYRQKHPQAAAVPFSALPTATPAAFPQSQRPGSDLNLISFDEDEQPLSRGLQPAPAPAAAADPYLANGNSHAWPTASPAPPPFSSSSTLGSVPLVPVHDYEQGTQGNSVKDILGIDPDEFNEDQLTADLASLGFTKEQLMDRRAEGGVPQGTPHAEDGDSQDATHDGKTLCFFGTLLFLQLTLSLSLSLSVSPQTQNLRP